MPIAGLDIGSGGCKCTIFSDDGKVSAYSFKEYSLERGPYGHMELNPLKVWQAVCDVCLDANNKHAGSPVEALCIASFGESGVVVDVEGEVLYNSMMYTDPRGEEQCQALIDKLGKNEIISRSGNNPHPMYSACKLMWLRDNEPEIFNQIDTFFQYSDYILYKLSQEKHVDWSLAARTMMFNVALKQWDDVLLNAAGLSESIFPKAVKTGTVVAKVTSEAADSTGFGEGMLLLLGGQDQIVAAVGGGLLTSGQAVNGMGSVDCITPIFDDTVHKEYMGDRGYSRIPYIFSDSYVTYAFNFSGGSLLRWYRDKFGQAAIDQAKKNGVSPYVMLESQMPCEPTGILVLPHFQGAATPYMDISSVGAIVGLSMDTDSGTLYRALMEGSAYEMMVNIKKLREAGVEINRLTACGGGSRSEACIQMRADIFGIPIDVLEVEEAGTLGAAIMAGVACGKFKDIEDGVKQLVHISKTFYPDEKNSKSYSEHFLRYERMYENICNIQGR